eukprot:TRINITY_DN65343_c0_g1_i1.p1 TRINITY_DN65343_c0_g1~~TRINITY_DN65343_c0_g1_i1.p1  ORF type:complete len:416 (+),score=133.66 TRINITY_DN65343_c0_g1_i1:76-1323(+)
MLRRPQRPEPVEANEDFASAEAFRMHSAALLDRIPWRNWSPKGGGAAQWLDDDEALRQLGMARRASNEDVSWTFLVDPLLDLEAALANRLVAFRAKKQLELYALEQRKQAAAKRQLQCHFEDLALSDGGPQTAMRAHEQRQSGGGAEKRLKVAFQGLLQELREAGNASGYAEMVDLERMITGGQQASTAQASSSSSSTSTARMCAGAAAGRGARAQQPQGESPQRAAKQERHIESLEMRQSAEAAGPPAKKQARVSGGGLTRAKQQSQALKTEAKQEPQTPDRTSSSPLQALENTPQKESPKARAKPKTVEVSKEMQWRIRQAVQRQHCDEAAHGSKALDDLAKSLVRKVPHDEPMRLEEMLDYCSDSPGTDMLLRTLVRHSEVFRQNRPGTLYCVGPGARCSHFVPVCLRPARP